MIEKKMFHVFFSYSETIFYIFRKAKVLALRADKEMTEFFFIHLTKNL